MYINPVIKKVGMGRMGVRFLEEGRELRLPSLLYANDLVLCGESEEYLKVIVGCFVKVCRKRGWIINAR